MGFLGREQVIKGLYLAIGSKHHVPKDLLLIIYRLTKDDSEVRDYHTDAIFRNTIPNYSCNGPLPEGRGLEWAIKWEDYKGKMSLPNKKRTFLLTQLRIFGDKDYLLERHHGYNNYGNYLPYLKRSSNQLKLKYLNTSPMADIVDDYYDYIESDKNPDNRICLDNTDYTLRGILPQPGDILIG